MTAIDRIDANRLLCSFVFVVAVRLAAVRAPHCVRHLDSPALSIVPVAAL